VDVHYDCTGSAPTAALTSSGLAPGAAVQLASLCVVEGWVAPADLPRIAAVAGVTEIRMPSYALPIRPPSPSAARIKSSGLPRVKAQPTASTAIDGNGVSTMRADQFVAQTGTRGAGVTVGVQSTGVANVAVIQARGELPAVQVVNPIGGTGNSYADEGTILLEEVHAVAPGAGLAYCGPHTFVEYTSCLTQLINAGASILVDDIIFLQPDLMSSESTSAQAIEQILAQHPNVMIFTAAGNYNGSYWEGAYAPVALGSALTCQGNGQVDRYATTFNGSPSETLTVTQSSSFMAALAWSDPAGHNTSNFDIYWTGPTSGCVGGASSSDATLSENLALQNGTYTITIATPDASLSGKFLKLWFGGDGLTFLSPSTSGSIVAPQAFASGVIAIGAVNASDGLANGIESFSSRGPITVQFPSPAQIQAPLLAAPDGIYVDAAGTYFTPYLFPDGNFYGTSASAPNAAAVAALLRGAFPSLTVSQLLTALESGATQLGASAPDGTFGYGRVDAVGALGTLPGPTITPLSNATIEDGSSTPAVPFTVSATGAVHFTVTSSNPALVPAKLAAAGQAGVTLAPSTCGTSTLQCTVSITPALAQAGTADVTLTALDGANRPASAIATVIVNDATAPPPSSTPPSTPPSTPTAPAAADAGGSKGGAGSLSWWGLIALALLAALRAREMRKPVIPPEPLASLTAQLFSPLRQRQTSSLPTPRTPSAVRLFWR
jgi:hypothetical protein